MSEEKKVQESRNFADIFYDIIHQTRNPFWFYFVVSWIVWNYDIVYFIFFQDAEIFYNSRTIDIWWSVIALEDSVTKYEFIKKEFYFNWNKDLILKWLLEKSIYPFIFTMFSIIIWPALQIVVKSITKWYKEVEKNY